MKPWTDSEFEQVLGEVESGAAVPDGCDPDDAAALWMARQLARLPAIPDPAIQPPWAAPATRHHRGPWHQWVGGDGPLRLPAPRQVAGRLLTATAAVALVASFVVGWWRWESAQTPPAPGLRVTGHWGGGMPCCGLTGDDQLVLLNIGPTVYAFDIRQPEAPVAVAQSEPLSSGRIARLALIGDKALVATTNGSASNELGGALHILDVRAARPRPWWVLGGRSTAKGLATMPVIGSIGDLAIITDLAVAGKTVLLATDAGLQIVDISRPEQPNRVSTVPLDGATAVVGADGLAVVALHGGLTTSGGGEPDQIRGLDTRHPESPRELWSIDVPAFSFSITKTATPLALVDGRLFAITPVSSGGITLAEYDVSDFRAAREIGRQQLPWFFGSVLPDDRGNLFLGFGGRSPMAVLPAVNVAEQGERYGILYGEKRRVYLGGPLIRQGPRRLIPAVSWHDLQPYPNHVVVPELALVDVTDIDAATMLPGVELLDEAVEAVSARGGRLALATRDKLRIASTRHLDIQTTMSTTHTTLLEWSTDGAQLYRASAAAGDDGPVHEVEVVNATDPERPRVTMRFPLPGQPIALTDVSGEPFAIVRHEDTFDTSLIQLTAQDPPLAHGHYGGPTALASTAERLLYAAACGQSVPGQPPIDPTAGSVGSEWPICLHVLAAPEAGGRFQHIGSMRIGNATEVLAMAAVDHTVYLLDREGALFVSDVTAPATPMLVGAPLALNTWLSATRARLLVNGAMLYLVTDRDRVLALDIHRSDRPRIVADMPMPGGGFSAVTLDDNQLIVAGGAAGLWFLEAPDTPRSFGID